MKRLFSKFPLKLCLSRNQIWSFVRKNKYKKIETNVKFVASSMFQCLARENGAGFFFPFWPLNFFFVIKGQIQKKVIKYPRFKHQPHAVRALSFPRHITNIFKQYGKKICFVQSLYIKIHFIKKAKV